MRLHAGIGQELAVLKAADCTPPIAADLFQQTGVIEAGLIACLATAYAIRQPPRLTITLDSGKQRIWFWPRVVVIISGSFSDTAADSQEVVA